MAWKEFALEVSRCKGYSDLGRMLLKLENMILQCFLNSNWLQNFLESWVQRCHNAHSAESVELLKEELVESILWSEVNSLPNKAAQLDMGSELKTWKHEVMKWFSTSHPVHSSGETEQPTNDGMMATSLQTSRKRPKLEVRRAEIHTSYMETQSSNQDATVEIDSGYFNSHDAVTNVSLVSEPLNGEVLEGSSGSLGVKWSEIVFEAGNSEVSQSKGLELTPVDGVASTRHLDRGNKSRQCIAFIEGKGRQCVRWASDGDVYCCVHLTSHFVGNSAKSEATLSVDSPMCEGTTVLGTKCKHRSLPGYSFCKKHQPRDDKAMISCLPDSKLKRKQEDLVSKAETSNCREIVPAAGVDSSLVMAPISVMSGDSFNLSSSNEIPERKVMENNATETVKCIGLCSQDVYEPCLESAKKHTLYCDNHLPSWLKRARNGKSRIVSKEVFLELLKNCQSREQKLHLHRACEIFYKLFKSLASLRNPVPKEVQFQWAFSEASKDVGVMEHLKSLVCSEKHRLRRIWGFGADENAQDSTTSNMQLVPVPVSDGADHENANIIKCKVCSEKFIDEELLGSHWMENHKKEAQWLFRGYVCAICLDSFTNKKVLETHVQERHCVQFVEQCMLFQCIPCGNHFGNPEELWSHVLSVHSNNFRLANSIQHQNSSTAEQCPQRAEPDKSTTVENINSEGQGATRRFICRFCGLKFDLLPDLGRHHQAAHMGPNSDGPRLSKRGIRFYAYKLKSGRLTRPKFKKGLGSASYRIRSRNAQNLKKPIQALSLISSTGVKSQPQHSEASSLARLADSQCSAVAKIMFSEIKKTKNRPNNSEILSLARSTCCRINLQASLEAKYGILPERMYLKAAKLCSEHNILVTWHQDGYICPRGCKRNLDSHITSELVPLSDDVGRPNSAIQLNTVTNGWTMDESHYVINSQHFSQGDMEKPVVLCEDISFGQESAPIPCVVDEFLLGSLHILDDGSDGQTAAGPLRWDSFTYITKPLLDESLGLEAESAQLGCSCGHSVCSPVSCDHVYLFNNDYEDAKDIYGKSMHAKFPYDEKGRIILEEGYLVYECNQWCRCSKACRNRVLQNGVQTKLEIFKTEKKGWAVRARESILRGTFICEYIGEVISWQEANERRNRYGEEHCTYCYEIDAHVNDMSRLIEGQPSYVIDATNYGNVSRYINHSCSPNLVNHQVLVESMDSHLAHIGLYASCDIVAGEELTYDYRYKLSPGEGSPCLCGASNCRGRLY